MVFGQQPRTSPFPGSTVGAIMEEDVSDLFDESETHDDEELLTDCNIHNKNDTLTNELYNYFIFQVPLSHKDLPDEDEMSEPQTSKLTDLMNCQGNKCIYQ